MVLIKTITNINTLVTVVMENTFISKIKVIVDFKKWVVLLKGHWAALIYRGHLLVSLYNDIGLISGNSLNFLQV